MYHVTTRALDQGGIEPRPTVSVKRSTTAPRPAEIRASSQARASYKRASSVSRPHVPQVGSLENVSHKNCLCCSHTCRHSGSRASSCSYILLLLLEFRFRCVNTIWKTVNTISPLPVGNALTLLLTLLHFLYSAAYKSVSAH